MPFTDMERWPRSAVAFAIADGWQKIRRADDKLAAHAACSTLVNELGARLCRRQQWQRPLLLLPTCNNLARWQQQCLHAYGQVHSSVCSGSVRVLTPV